MLGPSAGIARIHWSERPTGIPLTYGKSNRPGIAPGLLLCWIANVVGDGSGVQGCHQTALVDGVYGG